MGEAANQHHHIVMLPFMAQGHLIPFLGLAHRLRRRFRFTISIVTTPLNARYLRAANSTSPQPSDHHQINILDLPFDSSDHGLPPAVESTEALPLNQIIKLFHASTSLEAPFRSLIHDISTRDGRPPLCIISDSFTAWANNVAKSCNTVNVVFTTGGAYGTAAYVSLWQHLPHRKTDEEYFSLPGFPDTHRFHVSHLHPYLRAADGTDSWSRFFQPHIGQALNAFGWLCNTAEEIEPFGLDILRKYVANHPVWCIGPLLPPGMVNKKGRVFDSRTGRAFGVSPERCLQWLDSQPKRSVLYVSFGSQNTIGASQMMALATGLEDSKTPFIWVIRPPVGFDINGEFKPEWLPEGFEGRSQGLVVHGWAPQLEILCHESTGAFLSHCGWNSTVESLSQGVPMIGWPLAAEQGYNCKMLVEEMGVCVELTRGTQSQINREDVRRVVETAIGAGPKAAEMSRKAAEIGELIRAAVREEEGSRKGSSWRALEDFVSAIMEASNKRQAPAG